MMNRYIAEGVCDNVPTMMIEEFVDQIDGTVDHLIALGETDLARDWVQLRNEIANREAMAAREEPEDSHADIEEREL